MKEAAMASGREQYEMHDLAEIQSIDRQMETVNVTQGSKSAAYDERELARWGKRQQLDRNFRMLSIISLTCTLMITWESITVTAAGGLLNGGSAGIVYQFLFVWAGTLLQALVLAELGSMMPLSGGQYNWVAILAPKSCSKFLSYITGWLTLMAWQSGIASASFFGGGLVQGLAAITHPTYIPERWQATLLLYAVLAFGVFINTVLARVLPHIESFIFVIHIVGFFAILIPLIYFAEHNTAEEVFTVFYNGGGWSSVGLAWFVGLGPSQFAFLGIDAATHMAEEIKNANVVIPYSMLASVAINGVLGFAMVIAILFCLGDLESVLMTQYGFPFVQVYLDSVKSVGGTVAMASIITVAQIMCSVGILTTGSRMMWAFARDNGLPLSNLWAHVEPKSSLPLWSIGLSTVISCFLALINIGSNAAFNALTSLTLAGSYSAYGIAAGVLLHKRLSQPNVQLRYGPFQLGKWQIPVIIASLVYTVIGLFFSFWPPAAEVTAVSMNWSIAVFGGVNIFAIIWWFVWKRKIYTGPIIEIDVQTMLD